MYDNIVAVLGISCFEFEVSSLSQSRDEYHDNQGSYPHESNSQANTSTANWNVAMRLSSIPITSISLDHRLENNSTLKRNEAGTYTDPCTTKTYGCSKCNANDN